MTTGNSQVPDFSTTEQPGLFRYKPWLMVICAIAILCLLLFGGLTLAGPMIGDLVYSCQLVSIEPAPDTVLSYASVQEGVPFSVTARFADVRSSSPSHAVTSILALKSNTGDSYGSEDILAGIGRVEEWKCSRYCQVTVQGNLYPEAIYQGKITLLVEAYLVNNRSGMTFDNCSWMWIEYSVSP